MTPPEDAVQVAKDYIAEGHEPAVVFFDITGTINNRHIEALLAQMDYIFVPITTETGEMTSSPDIRKPCAEQDAHHRKYPA